MSVKQRLIAFIKYKSIGQKKFAESIGMSSGYVNAIRVSIQPNVLSRIAMYYPELNTGWLITGEGSMIKKPESTMEAPAQNVSDNVVIPREAWDVIRDQAASLKAKDQQMSEILDHLKIKDDQVERLIAKIDARNEKMGEDVELLKEHIKKGGDAGSYGHAAPGAAIG